MMAMTLADDDYSLFSANIIGLNYCYSLDRNEVLRSKTTEDPNQWQENAVVGFERSSNVSARDVYYPKRDFSLD